jgi:hypothetical protein
MVTFKSHKLGNCWVTWIEQLVRFKKDAIVKFANLNLKLHIKSYLNKILI